MMNGNRRSPALSRIAPPGVFLGVLAIWTGLLSGISLGQYDADGQPMAIGSQLYGNDPYAQTSIVDSASPDFEMPRGFRNNGRQVNPVTPSRTPFPVESAKDFQPGRLLAVVGTEPILEGDIRPMVEPILYKNREKIPEGQWESTLQGLIRPALKNHIQEKCLAQRFIKDMVGSKPVKDYVDAEKRINPRLSKGFYEKVIPKLLSDYEVASELELDQILRENGTSLAAQRRLFRDSVLAHEAISANVTKKPKIQVHQMRDYYIDHPDQWSRPARVRWRQLSVKFQNHPSKQAAFSKLAAMGNDVVYGGAPFEAVAKRGSEGVTAEDGGVFDWTEQGSLKSKVIDQTLFSIPINTMSDPLEDNEGFHIVEVVEREEARVQSLEEVQIEIKEKLIEMHQDNEEQKFIQDTIRMTRIYTLWPDEIPGALPLSDILPKQENQP